jgi:predicted adenine nucleotide alpha hydrolase (AANH) superfamily ATPase
MKVLLHICCAVCASACVERLREEGNLVSGFFYNPNIHPQSEYLRRLKETEDFARKINLPFFVGSYNVKDWFESVKGLESEIEGGQRCAVCFKIRLGQACQFAREKGFDKFTTTLTVSPHKDSEVINNIGRELAGPFFLERNFKKNNGFKRTMELAKQYRFYRQTYCGCIFSQKK